MIDETKLVNYLSGELNNSEIEEVEKWLSVPANKKEFEQIKQLWENLPAQENLNKFDANSSWETFKTRMYSVDRTPSRTHTISILKYAIAATIAILVGIAGFYFFSGDKKEITQYIAGADKLTKPITLPDGTQIFLNRDTKLSFSSDFNKEVREVNLSGEAYFDVAKNPAKPFIIKTATARIKVVGTSFNVLAYSSAPDVKVSVESGIVEMSGNTSQSAKIRLLVGNEGTFAIAEKQLIFHKSFDANALAWKTNRLNFKNADLNYVASALNHTFGKQIIVPDGKFKKCRLTANFSNQSLGTILKVIQETLGITFSTQGNSYTITGPGC